MRMTSRASALSTNFWAAVLISPWKTSICPPGVRSERKVSSCNFSSFAGAYLYVDSARIALALNALGVDSAENAIVDKKHWSRKKRSLGGMRKAR